MPYPQFDRSRLKILPLEQRVHDVDLKKVLLDPNDPAPEFSDPALPLLAEAMVKARREHDATVLMMYGAHVIRTGNALYMIELMKLGLVTHFATNSTSTYPSPKDTSCCGRIPSRSSMSRITSSLEQVSIWSWAP